MTHVLLLRSPSDEQPDTYSAHFASVGLAATSVQVLDTAFTNVDELQWMIETGPGFHGFKGVVITSGRSVDAWQRAVQEVVKGDDHKKGACICCGCCGCSRCSCAGAADWSKCPFYVVGETTASAIEKLRTSLPAHLLPTDVLGSAESGTSEALADFIITRTAPSKKNRIKLLYLTGDKNRDTLSNKLTEKGVELDAVQTYETKCSDEFASKLGEVVKSQKHGAQCYHVQFINVLKRCVAVKNWWIAFFAPSSTDFAMPALREHFRVESTSTPESPSSTKSKKKFPVARIAAIGPTTASHLKDALSLHVDAVAAKPTPTELATAISSTPS